MSTKKGEDDGGGDTNPHFSESNRGRLNETVLNLPTWTCSKSGSLRNSEGWLWYPYYCYCYGWSLNNPLKFILLVVFSGTFKDLR